LAYKDKFNQGKLKLIQHLDFSIYDWSNWFTGKLSPLENHSISMFFRIFKENNGVFIQPSLTCLTIPNQDPILFIDSIVIGISNTIKLNKLDKSTLKEIVNNSFYFCDKLFKQVNFMTEFEQESFLVFNKKIKQYNMNIEKYSFNLDWIDAPIINNIKLDWIGNTNVAIKSALVNFLPFELNIHDYFIILPPETSKQIYYIGFLKEKKLKSILFNFVKPIDIINIDEKEVTIFEIENKLEKIGYGSVVQKLDFENVEMGKLSLSDFQIKKIIANVKYFKKTLKK